MKAQNFGPAVVWVLMAFACHIPGTCKVGQEADCPFDAFCYAGENAKKGDMGVCTQLPPDESPPDASPPDTPPDTPPVGTLAIHGFGPLEATHGSTLIIQGANFSAVPAENSVTLNGVPATIASAVPSEIKIVVPKSTLCSGPVRVTVAGKTVVSSTSFTYVPMLANVTTVFGDGNAPLLNNPCGIALDEDGNLYVTEFSNHRISKITSKGAITQTHFAGTKSSQEGDSDGVEADARFRNPCGITTDAKGYFYVTDGGTDRGRIRRISMQAEVRTLADDMRGYLENPISYERFSNPRGIVRDAEGNLYVADSNKHRIRKISLEGEVRTLAGSDTDISGSVDGQGAEARFNVPRGVAMDLAGNLYVADGANSRIRRISPEGRVSTLSNGQGFVENPENPMHFSLPRSIVIDKTGIFYVVDMGSHHIQQLTPSGKLTLFAGTSTAGFADGKNARFSSPRELIMDADGNLLLADYGNHRIRKIILE